MNKTHLGSIHAAAVVLLLALAMSACRDGDSDGPSGDSRRIVDAPIESIDILVRESFPPGYTAHITSGLPSGCAKFNEAKVTGRTGDSITIAVTNTLPAATNIACTTIYGFHETNLDLGQDFVSGRTYAVKVNDKTKTFVAQ